MLEMETGKGEGCSTQISPAEVSLELVLELCLFSYDARIKLVEFTSGP